MYIWSAYSPYGIFVHKIYRLLLFLYEGCWLVLCYFSWALMLLLLFFIQISLRNILYLRCIIISPIQSHNNTRKKY